ncbi:MAG: hypothetical protein FJ125_01220, partial [Deltaproteobacteria bacterium]|nr:hypothetical protein [Deltaproteobacteria bacterium]
MSPTATAALGDRGASPASPGGLLDALLAAIAPADEEVSDLRIGSFLTAVVSRGCGLASPLAAQWSRLGAEPVRRAGALLPARVAELCPLVHSDNPLEASLGLAALNSLLSPEPEQWVEGKSHELLAELARGRRVAVVGHFPFVERLRPLTDRLWCFELPGRQLPSDLGPEAMD